MSNEVGGVNLDFHNKYPRIWATAENYGFTKEDIEQMVENEIMLDEYCLKDLGNIDMCQIALRFLMIKLDVRKEHFRESVITLANTKTEDEIKRLVGWRQVNIVYALAGYS